ncbi:MAG: acyl carrier protein [Idiomarinaceae bacterium]|uniref:Acyl carrier protein n=1 Tax=Pseudidiomarina aquimaris TaxID=641841 RepID=A0A432XHA4_9GAMM|nr:acyl carrier protein [Pseudidiomarina aquimaris]MBG23150.1 acyl carrier protein [Idiomarinaceae bacterium]RUO48101.1 acyl carrier protein [Pseudidiomarina aquimaris]|tara:strand:- start:939 stop:1193 length:255 start_codon:yes stop_codon:yes gene_type:complete
MQTREDVYQTLEQILMEDFEIDAEEIKLDANLYQDLDLDSIDAVDLVVKLREITGKKISPDAFKAVRTVEDVVDEVLKLIQEPA